MQLYWIHEETSGHFFNLHVILHSESIESVSSVTSDKFSCPCTVKQANHIAPQTFLASEAPRYHTGILYTLVMMSAYIALAWASWFVMLRENKRRDKLALTDPSYTKAHDNSDVLNGLRDLTDRQNGHFRYSG